MAMRISETWVESNAGRRSAVVLTPSTHVRVGRQRLEALRTAHPGGDLDREILAKVRSLEPADRLVVFRGRCPDGKGSWGFDEDLTEAERSELGFHLVSDELPTYRRLVAAGVFAIVHVEWGEAEVKAYRIGTQKLLAQLEGQSIQEVEADQDQVAVHTADRWILQHLNSFYDEGYDQVLRSVLVAHLSRFEERIPHFRAMVSKLPAAAIR